MEENPYKSPSEEPIRGERDRPGTMPVAGALLIGLAVFVWLPMAVTALVLAVAHPEKDLLAKLLSAPFNGAVALALLWFGQRLRRGRQPKAP
jgi:hypothetical protein